MRQEESQYLASDIEEIKKLPDWHSRGWAMDLVGRFWGGLICRIQCLCCIRGSEKYGDLW